VIIMNAPLLTLLASPGTRLGLAALAVLGFSLAATAFIAHQADLLAGGWF
jgi:hypothetical protein